MEYSTTKISPGKINISAGHALIKSPRLRKFQQKPEEACTMYFMQLRSGLIIKKACYFKKETTQRHSLKTTRKYKKQHLLCTTCAQHLERSAEGFAFGLPMVQRCATAINRSSIQERPVSLSTYNDQSIIFAFVGEGYEISVEDIGKKQNKGKVLFRYYDSPSPTMETGDDVDGHGLTVSLSPTNDKDFLLHANNQEYSVELQKCENPPPDRIFFLLHREPTSSEYVSFECKSNRGVFIGVKENRLALIKVGDKTEGLSRENIIFKLS